jgi:hypothetical protein
MHDERTRRKRAGVEEAERVGGLVLEFDWRIAAKLAVPVDLRGQPALGAAVALRGDQHALAQGRIADFLESLSQSEHDDPRQRV